MTTTLDMKSFEMMGFEELSAEEMALVDGGANTTGFWLPNGPAWLNYIIIAIVGPYTGGDPMVNAANNAYTNAKRII
jgi:hypothetical protein